MNVAEQHRPRAPPANLSWRRVCRIEPGARDIDPGRWTSAAPRVGEVGRRSSQTPGLSIPDDDLLGLSCEMARNQQGQPIANWLQ